MSKWSVVLALCVGCGAAAPAPTTAAGPVANHSRDADKPHETWSAACRRELTAAAADFRGRAPTIYPQYATLNSGDDGANAADIPHDSDAAAVVRISPGRTWSFVAAAETDAAIASHAAGILLDKPATEPAWMQIPDTELAFSRRAGDCRSGTVVERALHLIDERDDERVRLQRDLRSLGRYEDHEREVSS